MRKILSFLTAILFVGSIWAADPDPVVCTMPSSGSISNNKLTVNEVEWTIATTVGAGSPTTTLMNKTYDGTAKSSIMFGSSKSIYYKTITLSTDYFADYNVTSVTVHYALNGGVSTTVTAKQGDITIGSDTYSTGQKWHNATMNSESGEGGNLSISISTTQALALHSITISYTTTTGPTTVSKPTFSLAEGTYEGTQSIALTCKTENATIHYTVNGTDPTAESDVYTDAIVLDQVGKYTIKALAMKEGLENSEVVSASYTIIDGPDVTLDFSDNTEWQIPQVNNQKTTGLHAYTAGDYTISLYGPTGNGYYYDATNHNILLGKQDAYMVLPVFANNAIARIVTMGVESGSGSVTFNIYQGETAVSEEATSCKVDHTFELTSKKKNTEYTLLITNANNIRIQKIKIWFGEESEATAISNTAVEGKAVKSLQNGMLIIEKGGKKFNAQGQLIK